MRRFASLLLVLSLALLSTPIAFGSAVQAQTGGLSYVSPTYGYGISWGESWYLTEESSEGGIDSIILQDGLAFVSLYGSSSFLGNADRCAVGYETFVSRDENHSDIVSLDGEVGVIPDGGNKSRAWATIRYTYRFDDGTMGDFVDYIECRTIVPGRSVVQFLATFPFDTLQFELQQVLELAARITLPALGEPGPALVSDMWRVAVAGAVRGVNVPELRLKENDGRHWVVVVADLTNWGADEAAFDWGDASLYVGDERVDFADKATLSVARTLRTAPSDVSAALSIPPGETMRAALAFRIGESASDVAFRVGGETVSLSRPLSARGVLLEELPEPVGPIELVEASVVRVADGAHIDVMVPDGAVLPIVLIGVDAPIGENCFADESTRRLKRLAGEIVWLEIEFPGNGNSRYVWAENDDGHRILLNQALIQGGHAGHYGSADVRFGSWLIETEEAAKSSERGLWGRCTAVHGRERPEATPTAAP